MSTRATYKFTDEYNSFTVYSHYDGYPEGAVEFINNALEYAWPLPRFEADEFAAAFVAANKDGGGGIRLTTDHDAHGDTEYQYDITCKNGEIYVESVDCDEDDEQKDVKDYLNILLKKYKVT